MSVNYRRGTAGRETSLSVPPRSSFCPACTAKSPRDTIPTRRFSRLSIGKRRICLRFHEAHRFLDFLIFKTVNDVRGHDVAHFGLRRIASFGRSSHGNVTISERAFELVSIADRDESDVEGSSFLPPLLSTVR